VPASLILMRTDKKRGAGERGRVKRQLALTRLIAAASHHLVVENVWRRVHARAAAREQVLTSDLERHERGKYYPRTDAGALKALAGDRVPLRHHDGQVVSGGKEREEG